MGVLAPAVSVWVGKAANRSAIRPDGVRIQGWLKTTWIMAQKPRVPVTAQAPGRSESFDPDSLYARLAEEYGPALARIARSHEADADLNRDLLQDLHLALWRSLRGYDGRCSLRTWVYRVAHNTAVTYVIRRRRSRHSVLCTLEELDAQDLLIDPDSSASGADYDQSIDRLYSLIRRLAPLDRQIMLLYLEDLDAAEIATTTGLSPGNVATKVHRIKRLLTRLYHSEDPSHE
jgi:RNA polymerase sigma-70 factor, ECF subfamily